MPIAPSPIAETAGIEFGLAPPRHDHLSALSCETLGGRKTDTAVTAGDQSDLTFELP
jgi:hypothetical protein